MNLQSKHMLSPSSLQLKNNWGTCQKWWGEIWKSTWNFLLRVKLGHPPLYFWPSWVGLLIFAFYLSLPRHHDHWSYGSKSYQTSSCVVDMLKSCPSAVTLTSGSLYHPKSFCILLSCIGDVGFIMALLRQGHFPSTSTHYPGTWLRDSLLVP